MNAFLSPRIRNWESTEDRHIQAPKSFIRCSRANLTRSGSQPLASSPQITEEPLHFSFWRQDYFIPLLGRGFWTYAVLKIVCHFYFRIILWITKKKTQETVWGLPYVTDAEHLRICVFLNRGGLNETWNDAYISDGKIIYFTPSFNSCGRLFTEMQNKHHPSILQKTVVWFTFRNLEGADEVPRVLLGGCLLMSRSIVWISMLALVSGTV